MNNKFYNLTKVKQNAILNAGYRVFSENGYRKSPMSEIAKEAGISKSLLFHYFKNKKEYYLYLYNNVFNLMGEIAEEEVPVTETDFFKLISQSSKCKYKLLDQHAYILQFITQSLYEEDEEVVGDLSRENNVETINSINALLGRIDKNKFKDGLDIGELINVIGWCAEGFWKEKYRDPNLDMDAIDTGFEKIIDFFRNSCYKEEYLK